MFELRMLFFEWLVLLLGTARSHGGRRSSSDCGRGEMIVLDEGESLRVEDGVAGRSARRSDGARKASESGRNSENAAVGRASTEAIRVGVFSGFEGAGCVFPAVGDMRRSGELGRRRSKIRVVIACAKLARFETASLENNVAADLARIVKELQIASPRCSD